MGLNVTLTVHKGSGRVEGAFLIVALNDSDVMSMLQSRYRSVIQSKLVLSLIYAESLGI